MAACDKILSVPSICALPLRPRLNVEIVVPGVTKVSDVDYTCVVCGLCWCGRAGGPWLTRGIQGTGGPFSCLMTGVRAGQVSGLVGIGKDGLFFLTS